MKVFLNGELVPEAEARVSAFDRGFLYGDGLFETMLVLNRKPFRCEQHLERLCRGAEWLRLPLPRPASELQRSIAELIAANELVNALLRLTVSRGIGPRGYSPSGATHPTLVMSLHPFSPDLLNEERGWRLATASIRVPAKDGLAQFKTCNKLPQILARAEAEEAGADEAVLLNTDGYVAEAASSNLFWIHSKTVGTPPLTSGILAGVTRAVVLEICERLRLEVREAQFTLPQLGNAEGVFLSLSSLGVVPAAALDGLPLPQSPIVEQIRSAFLALLRKETGFVS